MGKERQEVREVPEEEKTQQIYITQSDYDRLDGDEGWDKHIRFSNTPSSRFCIKTRVPVISVSNGIFDPALSEPDMIVERCEEVPASEIKKAEKKAEKKRAEAEAKNSLVLKKGQTVWYELSVAGYTTYEEALVGTVSKKKGIFYLDNGDGNDPSGPYFIKNGRLVDESASNMLRSRVRILPQKPKNFHPEE